MELLCCEGTSLRATADPAILHDPRVLERLLAAEDQYATSCAYFKCLQTEIEPHMRKILGTWMLEVCEEQRCDDVVFPLAMNYLDRFLSTTRIRKTQLQLTGAVCLLLASKFRQTKALPLDCLSYYTDYSVTPEEIKSWELLVLSRLKWDIASVTANDFVEHLLARLPLGKEIATVRRHTAIFISLCATEHHFSGYSASVVATASVAAATHGLNWLQKPWSNLRELVSSLQQITGIESDCIQCCVEQIEELLSANVECIQQAAMTKPTAAPLSGKTSCNASLTDDGSPVKPETPTDIQDIHF